MPALVGEFRTDVATVLGALSVYLAGLGVGQLVYGPLSDQHGRRPLLIVGMVVFILGSCVCALAGSISIFLWGRLLQALGAGAAATLGRAMIRDVHGLEGSASTIGYSVMAATVASGIAPVVGGLLDEYAGWRSIFFVLALIGAVLLIVCIFALPETRPKADRLSGRADWIGYVTLLRSGPFVRHALFSSFLFGCWYGFVSGVPIIVIGVWGESSTSFALWWTVGSACYIVGNYLAGRYSRSVGIGRMILAGSVIVLAGAAILVGFALLDVRHPLAMFGPMGILLIGSGISQPSAAAGAINANHDRIGAASALLGSMQIVFAMACITLIGALPSTTALSFVCVCAGMAFAAVLAYAALSPRGAAAVT